MTCWINGSYQVFLCIIGSKFLFTQVRNIQNSLFKKKTKNNNNSCCSFLFPPLSKKKKRLKIIWEQKRKKKGGGGRNTIYLHLSGPVLGTLLNLLEPTGIRRFVLELHKKYTLKTEQHCLFLQIIIK